ncbi:MAG TPA: AarF/UbiB family protein, partial [Ktedonobacterales bacterium]
TLLREKLAHRNDILIPAVVPEYSTGRLLVTDFVEGIKITDRPALLAAGIDPRAVARLLNDVYAEQLMRLGFVHADPHPGNLLVQHGPRLVLLDHGLTLQVPPHIVRALSAMVRALVNADFDALAAALAEAGLRLDQQTSVMALLQVVGVVLGGQRAQEAVDLGKQLSASIGDIPVELITVGRALGLLDGITRTLAPGLDTLEIVARYT